jgi:hypothetical protein
VNVKELIAYLQTQPQDLEVVYRAGSEYCLLEKTGISGIQILEACEPRQDGWVHEKRPDKPTRTYLAFPGN